MKPDDPFLEQAWIDRDLSWLEFNRRVRHEAQDERTPLLERLKFLAIFTSNLDEFYMKRVGLLRGKVKAHVEDDPRASGGDATRRLAQIRRTVLEMLAQQAETYHSLLPDLARHGIVLAHWDRLSGPQREELSAHFDANVSPVLTPLGFDTTHPFPFISNLSTNWTFILRQPGADERVPVRGSRARRACHSTWKSTRPCRRASAGSRASRRSSATTPTSCSPGWRS